MNNKQKIFFLVLTIAFLQASVFPVIASAEVPPTQVWVAKYGGDTYKYNTSLKVTKDTSGNIYVTGYSDKGLGDQTYDLDYTTIKYDTDGNLMWSARYDFNGNQDIPSAIAVDGSGNTYVTGQSYWSGYSRSSFATIKYDTNGNQIWAIRYNGGLINKATGVIVDSQGDIYVSGLSYGGGGSGNNPVLVKYDTNGNQIWERVETSFSSSNDTNAPLMKLDNFGGVILVTNTFNDQKFAYGVIKYDTDGNNLFTTTYGTGKGDYPIGLAFDAVGNIYIGGYSYNEKNDADFITIKYTPNGGRLWVARYDSGYPDGSIALVVSDIGEVYITGHSGSFTTATPPNDFTTIKYDTNGNQLWIAKYNNGGQDLAHGITLDVTGNLYVVGQSSNLQNNDSVVVKYRASDGAFLWNARYDGGNDDHANDVLVDVFGNIYVTGLSEDSRGVPSYMAIKYKQNYLPLYFWSQLQNFPQGWLNLRQTPGTKIPGTQTNKPDTDVIKIVPSDWVLKVATTTDANGNPIEFDDGYQWYGVVDPTDNAIGWMASKDLNTGAVYLPYDPSSSVQTKLEAKATTTPYQTKEARTPVVLGAVGNYYSTTTASNSLYGGGGGYDGLNNFQTFIQGSLYPKELVLAIAGHESAGTLNNEICAGSRDGGIGIMQITSEGFKGLGSALKNYPKTGDCRASSSTSTYYSNAPQGIYANIKDGLRTLQEKYRKKCPNAQLTAGSLVYTCQDIERVLMTWGYNGKVLTGNYLRQISDALRDLSTYFPGVTYANNDQLIEKLRVANANRIEFKKFSPVEIEVVDSQGRATGFDGTPVIKEEIPFSRYDRQDDGGVIFFPQSQYRYRVIGTGTGTYGFSVEFTQNDILRVFHAINIPVVPGEIHEYSIDWDALDRGERGVTVRIDANGDGIVDRVVQSDSVLTEIEPPVISINTPVGDHLLNSQAQIQFTATDALSGIATTSAKLNGTPVTNGQFVTLTQAGANTLEVTAMDNEGNSATTASTFKVIYATNGFLTPIKTDGTGVYNQGRTLPVKFELHDANSAVVPSAPAQLYVAKISNSVIGTDEIPLSTSAADTGNQFRYDSSGHTYIFNLSTDTMSPGTWQVKAVLGSGQVITVVISIR